MTGTKYYEVLQKDPKIKQNKLVFINRKTHVQKYNNNS